jgi:hypothetical protein
MNCLIITRPRRAKTGILRERQNAKKWSLISSQPYGKGPVKLFQYLGGVCQR